MNQTNHLSTALASEFYLTPSQIRQCDKYYILYWQSRYLLTQLLTDTGVIKREGIQYKIILQDGINLAYLGDNPDKAVKVSFRRMNGTRVGYVIVKKAGEKV